MRFAIGANRIKRNKHRVRIGGVASANNLTIDPTFYAGCQIQMNGVWMKNDCHEGVGELIASIYFVSTNYMLTFILPKLKVYACTDMVNGHSGWKLETKTAKRRTKKNHCDDSNHSCHWQIGHTNS